MQSYSRQGQELDENENEEGLDNPPEEDDTLEYKEFGMFLHALKQYYVYCQVFYSANIEIVFVNFVLRYSRMTKFMMNL